MQNPIPHSSLFVTPKSVEDLDSFIRQLPDNERPLAYHYTMLAFNLAYKMVEDAKASEKKSNDKELIVKECMKIVSTYGTGTKKKKVLFEMENLLWEGS